MPLYEYVGLDARGEKKLGFLEARDSKSVKLALFEQGIFPTRLGSFEGTSKRKPSLSQGAFVARQIALFIKMGFTLDDAFFSTAQAWKRRSIQKKLFWVAHRLKEGLSLEQALAGVDLFPAFLLRVLAVAEKSGKLVQVLEFLADHCDKKIEVRNQWIQSLLYPALLFVVSLGVLGLVSRWVFPSFVELFSQVNRPLPWITQAILFGGRWISKCLLFFLVMSAAVAYALARSYRLRKEAWIKFSLKVPGLQSILKKRNACEVAHNLVLLLTSGFQVPESFALAGEGKSFIQDELLKFRISLEEGREFEEGVLDSIFPKGFLKMLSVGFKTGQLAQTSEKVSQVYEKDLDVWIHRFTTLLGPILLLGVGAFIGVVVIGVVLPIFDWSF